MLCSNLCSYIFIIRLFLFYTMASFLSTHKIIHFKNIIKEYAVNTFFSFSSKSDMIIDISTIKIMYNCFVHVVEIYIQRPVDIVNILIIHRCQFLFVN